MHRRAFARRQTGAALLLGLSLRAASASAEPAGPEETRVGTVEGKAAGDLPSAAETPPIPAAPIVAPRLIRDEGVADGSIPLPALRAGTATVQVEISRHLAEQTNLQRVPGDEAGVSFALSPCVEGPGVSSHTRQEARRIPGAFGDPCRAFEALPVPLFDVGGPIESPFARGIGSLFPVLLSLLGPDVKLDYRDFQTRATHEPSAPDRFSTFGFGSYDLLGEKRNGGILSRLGDACRPKITFTW